MEIVQLVSDLPPHIGGMSEYSLRLAEQLLKKHGIFTQFIAYSRNQPQVEPVINGFPAAILPAYTPEALLSLLPKNIDGMILHYSGRGQPNSALWLLEALQSVKRLHHLKFVVMFHELNLTYKWNGINFPYPTHFSTAYSIAKIADTVLTDSSKFQAILSKWLKHPITCIPDFSTVGEPEHVPPLAERNRRMIVFGGRYSRPLVYRKFLNELLRSCQSLKIEEIYDIGPSIELHLPKTVGVHVVEMGVQSSEVISQLMLTSLAGFLDYTRFPGALGKSTVFAAYCAHGLIPVSSRYNPSEADGIEINKQYLVPKAQLKNLTLMQLQSIADNARKWYGTHTLSENANVFASSLR